MIHNLLNFFGKVNKNLTEKLNGCSPRILCLSTECPNQGESVLQTQQRRFHPPPPLETVSQLLFCHPEFISGSRKCLILLDAETSSA